ncbi:MAG TPA: hypothetical protein GX746_06525 [Bacteroidales bacterium]|nr:hypothetical protein [Bacteroidales bacterium]
MRNRATLIFLTLIFLVFVGCDKDEARIPNYFVEFATVVKTKSSIMFELDNGYVLTPDKSSNYDLDNGNRVILNYTPLESGSIKINSVQVVFLGTIEAVENPSEIESDAVKIISIWKSGKYLNISLQVDYHSKAHSSGLFKDMQLDIPILYFKYSRLDDPPGAPTLKYLSFDIENLRDENFSIYINTHEGERKFDFYIK